MQASGQRGKAKCTERQTTVSRR